MLDRYWFGDVERISPEAPVPVVRICAQRRAPGRRGERCAQRRGAGRQATLISVIGDDEAGTLAGAAARRRAAVRTSFHRDAALPTTVKLRVIARQQQLLRIDFETTLRRTRFSRRKLADYERTLPEFDVIVLSDYGKGGLAHIARMIELARMRAERRCWSTRREKTGCAIAAPRC